MIKKICITCGAEFEAKRRTKLTCSDSCRSNIHQKKARREEWLVELKHKISSTETDLSKIKSSHSALRLEVIPIQQRVSEIKGKMQEIERLLSLNDQELSSNDQYNNVHKLIALPYAIRPNNFTAILSGCLAIGSYWITPSYLQGVREKLKQEHSTLKISLLEPDKTLRDKQKKITTLQDRIMEGKSSIAKLKEKQQQIEEELGYAKKRKQAAEPPSSFPDSSSGLTALQLMDIEFDTFFLPGKLGEFMGELERDKLSIALTGDPGAGKTSISLGLAKAFAQAGFRVAYLSLELGIGKLLQDAAKRYQVSTDEVSFFDHTDPEDIRKKAGMYDVIIVDSFVKLDCKATLVDELRHQYPKTIFVFILQKTSKGTSRGGSSLDYDASMVMDVTFKEGIRQVYMKKSRYGTIGWTYFPENDKVFKL